MHTKVDKKMKTLTLLLFCLFSVPFGLSAQTVTSLLDKVSTAIAAKQWEQAIGLFRQAIRLDADKSEMFYWTNVDKNSEFSMKIADELASYYKKSRNYDKAYLFYKELIQKKSDNVEWLVACAETEVCRGKEKEALQTYLKVISLDMNNLDANIFVGNYYYLMAEREKQKLERDYKKINSPTRMQYARYKDGLSRLMGDGYGKAKEHLQNVIRQFPSTEAMRTLEKIKKIEREMK